MSRIVHINGNPYTTAMEDMQLKELHSEFTRRIQRAIDHAFQTRLLGDPLRVDLREAMDLLTQAYYMGRNDA